MIITSSALGRKGRLGNQMFQIAAMVGFAKRHSAKVVFPPDLFTRTQCGQFCALDIFAITRDLQPPPYFETTQVVCESQVFDFQEIAAASETTCIDLDGFWQHPKYFEHAEKEVRDAFTIIDVGLVEEAKSFANGIRQSYCKSRIVCLHLRLGDAISQKSKYFVADGRYIKRAIGTLDLSDSVIVVFSGGAHTEDGASDRDMVSSLMEGVDEAWVLAPDGHAKTHHAMMRQCDDFILSGGTFGWWAAFLSKTSENKRIVEPLPWFVSMDGYEQPDGFEFLEVEEWCLQPPPVNPKWRVESKRAMHNKLVVCLTVYNRGHFLVRLIEQLDAMAYHIDGVVITDWSSTDIDVTTLARKEGPFPITVLKKDGRFNLGGGWTNSASHASIQDDDVVVIMCNDLEITTPEIFIDARKRAIRGKSAWCAEQACRDRSGATCFAGGSGFAAMVKADYLACGGWGEGEVWGGDDDVFMQRIRDANLSLIYLKDERIIASFHERDLINDLWYKESVRAHEDNNGFRV